MLENTSLFDYYSLNIENELISSIDYKVKVGEDYDYK